MEKLDTIVTLRNPQRPTFAVMVCHQQPSGLGGCGLVASLWLQNHKMGRIFMSGRTLHGEKKIE